MLHSAGGTISRGVLPCRSLSDFRLMKKVGEGALSEVYQAVHIPSGATVAVKLYAKVCLTHFTRRQIEREVELQSCLSHPHIVQVVRDAFILLEASPLDSDACFLLLHAIQGQGWDLAALSGTSEIRLKDGIK